MNNMLLEEEKTEDADRLAQIINYVNSNKQEEFDRIALNYVRECIENGTARELPRGILSEEFINAHRRELMKMIVESGYSDEDALAMMNDLMSQEQFDEEQM